MGHKSFNPPTHSGATITLRKRIMDILLPLLFIAAWVVLQLWVLPRFGVET